MNIYEKLSVIQQKLKAPKNQKNNFGNYNYRSCEDILEAVKPLLKEVKATLVISDTLEHIGERYYIKATVLLADNEAEKSYITNTAYAREEETKKGMDGSQITGASSSYARKYALNGLFAIDDTKDSDTTNDGGEELEGALLDQCAKLKIDLSKLAIYLKKNATDLTNNDLKEAIATKEKAIEKKKESAKQ